MVRKLCQRTGEKRQKPQQRIWEAAVNRDWDTVKELLQCDPSLITVTGNDDEYEISLLHLAIGKEADLKLVEYLVSQGANIHAQEHNGRTPLHAAVQRFPNIDTVQYLLSQDADVHTRDHDGKTALDYVIEQTNEADYPMPPERLHEVINVLRSAMG